MEGLYAEIRGLDIALRFQEGSVDTGHQFNSVPQSCLTLCNPMDCCMPGFPVHKGGVICISEVTDISPSSLDSILCFTSPAFRMMYSAYKLNKQGDNIQP